MQRRCVGGRLLGNLRKRPKVVVYSAARGACESCLCYDIVGYVEADLTLPLHYGCTA